MSSGTAAKIRLVRCPKCRQVLPEMPNVPVYQCGGCCTTLQAKIPNKNSKSMTSTLPETDAEETNNIEHASKSKEFSSPSHGTSPQCAGDCSSEENNWRDGIESRNCNGDNLKGISKLSADKNDASDQGSDDKFSGEKLGHKVSNDSQKIGSDNSEAGLRNDEHFLGAKLSNKDCNNQNDSLTGIEWPRVGDDGYLSKDLAHIENVELSRSLVVGMNLEAEENDEGSTFAAKVKAEADANSKIDSKGNASTVATHQSVGEGTSSDIIISSPNELLEQSQGITHHGFDRARSTDTFDTTDIVNRSSELSGTLIDLSKSPTTRSSRAYYDDSISSYEGTDDQVPNRHKHASKHAYRAANHAVSDVRSRRERLPISSNYGMQQHFKNSPPSMSERSHYPLNFSMLDRSEVLESTRLGDPVRLWRNLERDEYPSEHSFHTRESLARYESGSIFHELPNDLYYNSNFPSQDKTAYTYEEKLKLLRMIYELQDQLKASLNDKENGRVGWKDHQLPLYYDHQIEPEESSHNLVYPRYAGRVRDESNWSQQRKYSRIPILAEAAINRHQVDYSLCCFPKDRKWSVQVPPGLCHNKGFCRIHSRINLHSSHDSCPSSPQWHVDSDFPMYVRGTKSDDQSHEDHEVGKYLRDKYHLPKRHFRPLAGGAPFVTCSSCLKLLQLPADFLLFKRRCHQLKCGGCSEILKFSLVNSIHLIPYMSVTEAPPPSEVDEYSDGSHRRNFTSTSHVTDCPSTSCSDDCGPVGLGNGFQRNISYDSIEHDKGRKKFLNGNPSKGKNPVETNESAGPSACTFKSKISSSEIEELPSAAGRGGGSTLHHLMGYPSAREVIYGCSPSDWPMVE